MDGLRIKGRRLADLLNLVIISVYACLLIRLNRLICLIKIKQQALIEHYLQSIFKLC